MIGTSVGMGESIAAVKILLGHPKRKIIAKEIAVSIRS